MGPRKGQGKSKGKQPLKKAPPKRPPVAISDSDDERESEDQRVILEHLAALERAQGLSPGGSDVVETGGRNTRRSKLRRFEANIRSRISFLASQPKKAGDASEVVSTVSAAGQLEQDGASSSMSATMTSPATPGAMTAMGAMVPVLPGVEGRPATAPTWGGAWPWGSPVQATAPTPLVNTLTPGASVSSRIGCRSNTRTWVSGRWGTELGAPSTLPHMASSGWNAGLQPTQAAGSWLGGVGVQGAWRPPQLRRYK